MNGPRQLWQNSQLPPSEVSQSSQAANAGSRRLEAAAGTKLQSAMDMMRADPFQGRKSLRNPGRCLFYFAVPLLSGAPRKPRDIEILFLQLSWFKRILIRHDGQKMLFFRSIHSTPCDDAPLGRVALLRAAVRGSLLHS